MSAISNVIKAVFSTEEKQPLSVEELEIKYKEAGKVWQDLADQIRAAKATQTADELRKKYAGKFFSDFKSYAVKVLHIDSGGEYVTVLMATYYDSIKYPSCSIQKYNCPSFDRDIALHGLTEATESDFEAIYAMAENKLKNSYE